MQNYCYDAHFTHQIKAHKLREKDVKMREHLLCTLKGVLNRYRNVTLMNT